MDPLFVGIDVSKDHLDVHVRPTGQAFRVPNDPVGHRDLLATWADRSTVLRVILESTGGYETPVAAALAAAGFPVVIVNARQARDFAKALGYLAKTDALDAAVLAHFGDAVRPPVRPFPSPELQELRELLDRRSQLVQARVAETTRLATATLPAVRRDIDVHLRWLAKRINGVEAHIARLVEANVAWKATDDLLRSIPGIGTQVSRMLLGHVPELGTLGRRQVACLVGLAPLNKDSGKQHGQRHIVGGRAQARRALYMAALAAVRHGPTFKAHYAELRRRGKVAKVALVAIARKLLCIANAVVREKLPWRNPASATVPLT